MESPKGSRTLPEHPGGSTVKASTSDVEEEASLKRESKKIQLPKWFVITRNEYRVRTSGIRQIRRYFPFLVAGGLTLYVVVVAPAIIGMLVSDPVAFLLSQVAGVLIRFVLFIAFFMFITFPISYTLRDVKTAQQEIYLSAPIKPSDVLLGEFLGELLLYAIMIILLAGFFTALLKPAGLSVIQMLLITVIFIVTLSSALWIGTVISALVRTRLAKSASGKDMGKALSLLIVLPAVALMYAVMAFLDPGTGRMSLVDPSGGGIVNLFLRLMPSSWGGDLIVDFGLNPGNIAAIWPETVIRLGGLMMFFVVIVWIGVKMADRAYSLESTSFVSARARADNVLYRILKHTGTSGILFVTVFKMYIRRLQNLSYIAYIVGLLVIMNIFLVEPGEVAPVAEMGFFLFPMLAAFVASDITLRGKETLFIYKKAPHGDNRFIRTMVLKGWSVAIPISSAIVLGSMVLKSGAALFSPMVDLGLMLILVAGDVLLASGLFLLMPAYTERGGEFLLDVMVLVMISLGLFAVSLSVLEEILTLPFLHWGVGIAVLYIGKRNLNRIE
ncbi:MAG: hypothetical protein HXS43_02940 [Theionarchaea archaeon]|nr:hypothetical protein [Theionarchaea archaeon]